MDLLNWVNKVKLTMDKWLILKRILKTSSLTISYRDVCILVTWPPMLSYPSSSFNTFPVLPARPFPTFMSYFVWLPISQNPSVANSSGRGGAWEPPLPIKNWLLTDLVLCRLSATVVRSQLQWLCRDQNNCISQPFSLFYPLPVSRSAFFSEPYGSKALLRVTPSTVLYAQAP